MLHLSIASSHGVLASEYELGFHQRTTDVESPTGAVSEEGQMETFTTFAWLALGALAPVLTAVKMIHSAWRADQPRTGSSHVWLALLAIIAMFALLYAGTAIAIYAFKSPERDNYHKAQRYVTELLDAPTTVEFPPYDSFPQVCQQILGFGERDPKAPSVDHNRAIGLTTVWGYVDVRNEQGAPVRSAWRVVLQRGALQEIHLEPPTDIAKKSIKKAPRMAAQAGP